MSVLTGKKQLGPASLKVGFELLIRMCFYKETLLCRTFVSLGCIDYSCFDFFVLRIILLVSLL